MLVSNSDDYLMIEVIPDQNTSINNINLWIGGSLKKVNLKGNDLSSPSRSGGYNRSSGESYFTIPLEAIYQKSPDIACEEKELYIIAHISATVSTSAGMEEVSAWSEGNSIGNSQNATYSTYTTCCQSTGGGGCYPHLAWGGNFNQNGSSYYDTDTGGMQNIIADNGAVAGKIKWESGVFTFSFDQDWMFSDQNPQMPLLKINGFYEPGGTFTSLYEGSPSSYQGIYSVNISGYPYYQIIFNLQNCFTVNP